MRNRGNVEVTCDICGTIEIVAPLAINNEGFDQAATRTIRVAGWYTNKTRDIDLCPKCLNGLVLERLSPTVKNELQRG